MVHDSILQCVFCIIEGGHFAGCMFLGCQHGKIIHLTNSVYDADHDLIDMILCFVSC